MAEPPRVYEMLAQLAAVKPALAEGLNSAIVAVNKEFADGDWVVNEGDEVAIFPPVSGGDENRFPYPTYFALAEEPPDIAAIHKLLAEPDVGAIVTFSGSVRGRTQREGLPPETIHLEYEAYEEMALQKMAQIAEEIWLRWPLVRGIAIVQRVGKLNVGDGTTLVACASGHRDEGVFAAARYGIDRLKEIVPVWKKEIGVDKSVWVEGDYRPTVADN